MVLTKEVIYQNFQNIQIKYKLNPEKNFNKMSLVIQENKNQHLNLQRKRLQH